MRRSGWLLISGLGMAAMSGPALADTPFDGASVLLCALNQAVECSPGMACEPLRLEDVGAPPFFRIDAAGRTIVPVRSPPDDQRQSEIRASGQVDGKLILQGFEDGIENVRDGLGWTIAIAQDTGHFVLSASGDQVAFVVFGACTVADAGTP